MSVQTSKSEGLRFYSDRSGGIWVESADRDTIRAFDLLMNRAFGNDLGRHYWVWCDEPGPDGYYSIYYHQGEAFRLEELVLAKASIDVRPDLQ